MLLASEKLRQEQILHLLKTGPRATLEVVNAIRKSRPKATKQGIYKALRLMAQEEVVITSKGSVMLNLNWVRQLGRFVRTAEESYLVKPPDDYFLNMDEGDRMVYTFKTPAKLDAFWAHVLITLANTVPQTEHFYAYNSHYWFLIAHCKSETEFLQSFKESKRQLLLTVGGNTSMHRLAANGRDKSFFQYTMLEKPIFKKNYYINAISDYVLEIYLDPFTAEKIDEFFNTVTALTSVAEEKLQTIINERGRNRFVFSKKKSKAERVRRKFKKYFFIPSLA